MLSIVMPVCNVEEATNLCIDTLQENASGEIDIIVVDNASVTPYERDNVTTIRNEKNKGFWPSMLQGIEAAKSNHVLCMHNDVFIWEKGYDLRFLSHFARDHKLAIAGLFGGRGVGLDGGRGHPEGNMTARRYGMNMDRHGYWQKESHPAVVFDSLAMCFRRDYLYQIDYVNIPPHHWTDRIVTFDLVTMGFHARTVGIEFDHGGAFTSGTKTMNTFTEDWCREQGLEMQENWDFTLYMYGLGEFQKKFRYILSDANQLWVDENYKLMAIKV